MIILNNQPSYQTMHDPTKQRMYMKIYLGLVFQISLCLPIFAQALLKNESLQSFTQGLDLLEKEKYSAAQHCFETYLICPKNYLNAIEAKYYMAYCAVNLFQPHGASFFHMFIKKYPSHPKAAQAYYQLSNLYFIHQDFAKSITYYQKVDENQLDKDTQQALRYQLAYAYLSNKKFNRALVHFNAIKTQENAYTQAANYYAGYIALRNGNYTTALADFNKAAKNQAYKPVVPYMIVQVYYKQKRFKALFNYVHELARADIALKNQDEISLFTAEAHFFLQAFQAAAINYTTYLTLQNVAVERPIVYRAAYAFYKTKATDQAIKYFKTLACAPDSLGQLSSYYMGLLYLQTNQKILALGAFEQARQHTFLPAVQEEAAFQYAQLKYDLGPMTQAIGALKKFKKNYPKSQYVAEANVALSQAYWHTKDYDLAIAHLEALAHKSPHLLKMYQTVTFYRGTEYFNDERYEAAVSLLKKSLAYAYDKTITFSAYFWLGESFSALQAYEKAIPAYQQALKTGQNPYYIQALYGLAYAYFNTHDYAQALAKFAQYLDKVPMTKGVILRQDAAIRLADCYYANKDYDQALQLYDQAIQKNNPAMAHAYYQKGIIQGILGHIAVAQENFNVIFKNYRSTTYYEQALFNSAQLEFEQGNYLVAIKNFTRFIDKKPHSTLLPNTLLNRGIAYHNRKDYAQARKDYETVLQDYATHPNAESALLELQKMSALAGEPAQFEKYLAAYKAANPDSNSLEKIEFEVAKSLFYHQHYTQAIDHFIKFLVDHPQSVLHKTIHFLTAEAYYKTGDTTKALQGYYQSLQNHDNAHYNKIMLRIAHLEFQQKNFSKALVYYHGLQAVASNKREIYHALSGIMKTHEALQQYDSVMHYARLIIQQGNIAMNAKNEALLFLGKAAMHQGAHAQAVDYFLQTINAAKDHNAAEAQYLLAQVAYMDKNYAQSLELLFDLNKQFPSYTRWVDQSFLLIADNYRALDETLQAKATLHSIIAHAADSSLTNQARKKLADLATQVRHATQQPVTLQKKDREVHEFKTLEE